MCNVLGVLEEDDQLWTTFEAAVDLAGAENARLTLAKTTDAGRCYMWLSPFAFGGAYMPPPLDAAIKAKWLLAQAAELVPEWLPVTTLLLGSETQDVLLKLIRAGRYDVLVGGPKLFRHCPRLVRDLERRGIGSVCSGDPQPRALQRVLTRL
jgi:hypothetical protein